MGSCLTCNYCVYSEDEDEYICINRDSESVSQIVTVPVYDCDEYKEE